MIYMASGPLRGSRVTSHKARSPHSTHRNVERDRVKRICRILGVSEEFLAEKLADGKKPCIHCKAFLEDGEENFAMRGKGSKAIPDTVCRPCRKEMVETAIKASKLAMERIKHNDV